MAQLSFQLAPSSLAQTINPWTFSFGQLGLFNVNLGQAGDPALEERLINEVGSYGRQIGRIGDALKVLLAHVDLGALSKDEQAAIDALKLQLQHVDVIKAEGA